MRSVALISGLLLPFFLACAGPPMGETMAEVTPEVKPPPSNSIIRLDYSNIDGGSCMSSGGRPNLFWGQEWDQTACAPRSENAKSRTKACIAANNAECCTQIDATVIGWEAHSLGGEKLVSPLCRLK